MAKLRLGYLLMSTALTVVLSTATTVRAAPDGRDVIAAAIPLPETADVKPLTPADVVERRSPVVPSATAAAPSTAPATTEAAPEQKAQDIAVIPTDPVAAKIKELLSHGSLLLQPRKSVSRRRRFIPHATTPLSGRAQGVVSDRAKAAIAYLATVDSEGLDSGRLSIPNFKTATSPDQLAEADLRMTATLLTYARHAQNGRINPSRVVPEVAYTGEPVDPADALAKFGDGKDIAATLADFNPQNPHYKALKAKLVELRGGKNGAAARSAFPAGPR